MSNHNPKNERIKHEYRKFLKEARQQSESSIDSVDHALAQFDRYNNFKDFRRFHFEQAIGFKKYLANQTNQKTGNPLSKSTIHRTLQNLKGFFQWLSMQQGYKSTVSYPDAEYFNLSEKDVRIASARQKKRYPTLEQVNKVLHAMPSQTSIERRDRALIAFTILTGARDGALASFKLRHIDIESGCVHQDGKDVNTKFSKTFDTYFFEVGEDIKAIVVDWIEFLLSEQYWTEDDPLFPSTEMSIVVGRGFQATGLKREHWQNANPIRRVFKRAFEAANLPSYRPHSFRDTLVSLGSKRCGSPEEMKAWSQNLGHSNVSTTLTNYGEVQPERQAELIRGLESGNTVQERRVSDIAIAVAKELQRTGLPSNS